MKLKPNCAKSLLMLAAGGIGILVTLLTTTGIHSPLIGILYAFALTLFLFTIVLAILIFEHNATFIQCLINDKPAKNAKLKLMDTLMFWSFILGLLISISIGVFSGIIRFRDKEAPMSADKEILNKVSPPGEKRSFSGLDQLRPTDSPSPGQGQQSGGSNQGGSSGNTGSSGSNQSSDSQSQKK